MGINLYLCKSRTTEQQVLVLFLDAYLADAANPLVCRRIDHRLLALADPAHITQHMRHQTALRVIPMQHRLQGDARKTVFVHCKRCRLNIIQPRLQQYFFERRVLLQTGPKCFNLCSAQPDQVIDLPQHRLHVMHFLRDHLQNVNGRVACQNDTMSIQNESPHWGHGLDADMVIQRQCLVAFVLQDLERVETPDQYQGKHQRQDGSDPNSPTHRFGCDSTT